VNELFFVEKLILNVFYVVRLNEISSGEEKLNDCVIWIYAFHPDLFQYFDVHVPGILVFP
jgi:hypothetical protein